MNPYNTRLLNLDNIKGALQHTNEVIDLFGMFDKYPHIWTGNLEMMHDISCKTGLLYLRMTKSDAWCRTRGDSTKRERAMRDW